MDLAEFWLGVLHVNSGRAAFSASALNGAMRGRYFEQKGDERFEPREGLLVELEASAESCEGAFWDGRIGLVKFSPDETGFVPRTLQEIKDCPWKLQRRCLEACARRHLPGESDHRELLKDIHLRMIEIEVKSPCPPAFIDARELADDRAGGLSWRVRSRMPKSRGKRTRKKRRQKSSGSKRAARRTESSDAEEEQMPETEESDDH